MSWRVVETKRPVSPSDQAVTHRPGISRTAGLRTWGDSVSILMRTEDEKKNPVNVHEKRGG